MAARLPKETQKAIMQRVNDRRMELDLTVDQAAERAGITRVTYYNYLNHRRRLNMDGMRDFELALSLPVGELLKMAGRMPASLEDFAADPGSVLLAIDQDPKLTKAEREALRRVYESYVSRPRPRPRPAGTRRSKAS